MKHGRWSVLLVIFLFVAALPSLAQIEPIVIPAGTPEDVALQAITKEPDDQKKLAMYEDFVKQFASNPAAVAYGNWQLAQAYQGTGDLQKALDYGDKALASTPRSLDILVSQASIAQQMKNNPKLLDYSVRGGEVYNSIGKTKPEGIGDRDSVDTRLEQIRDPCGDENLLAVGAGRHHCGVQTCRTHGPDIADRPRIRLNPVMADSSNENRVLGVAEAVDGLRIGSVADVTVWEVDGAGQQERSGAVGSALPIDVGVVVGHGVEGDEWSI